MFIKRPLILKRNIFVNPHQGVGATRAPPVTAQHEVIHAPRPALHATIVAGIAAPPVAAPNVAPEAA